MEHSILQILSPLWFSVWWIFLLFFGVIVFKLFKPFLKGKLGEFTVSTHVKLYLKDPELHSAE